MGHIRSSRHFLPRKMNTAKIPYPRDVQQLAIKKMIRNGEDLSLTIHYV